MTQLHLPKSFERARLAVTPVMAAASASLQPELRRVVEYHWGWIDQHGVRTDDRAGKALRPTLAILSAEAVGAEAELALAGAAAMEMVHDFTLLHDDVMDDDHERRGRPAAWTCFGIGPAICGGDALILLAQQVLLGDPSIHRGNALSVLLAATQTVIAGQALDISFEGRVDISVEDYLSMSGKKTGALLGCSASIGAILAGGTEEQVEALCVFGEALGLAFQAVDDWLGIWGDPVRVGKPRASDLRQRKASLPIVMAMSSDRSAGRALREWMRSEDEVDEAAINRGVDWLDSLGTERATIALARTELDRALESLEKMTLGPDAKSELADLANFVVEREF
jgi:geranylgeranyl diphosphate synthase type I